MEITREAARKQVKALIAKHAEGLGLRWQGGKDGQYVG